MRNILITVIVVGILVLGCLISCEKDDFLVYNEEPEVIEDHLELDTSITPTIIAADFNFPVLKEIGQGVNYFPSIYTGPSCGQANIQMTDHYGIDITSINNESVVFTITDTVWYWEYLACCQYDSDACDIGFIIGSAERVQD